VKVETYRANAEFCLRQAVMAVRGDDVIAWRQLAESWGVLLRGETRLASARCKLSRLTRYIEPV
jgi:hypothetical protein